MTEIGPDPATGVPSPAAQHALAWAKQAVSDPVRMTLDRVATALLEQPPGGADVGQWRWTLDDVAKWLRTSNAAYLAITGDYTPPPWDPASRQPEEQDRGMVQINTPSEPVAVDPVEYEHARTAQAARTHQEPWAPEKPDPAVVAQERADLDASDDPLSPGPHHWEIVARSRMNGADWWGHPFSIEVRASSLRDAMKAASEGSLHDDWVGFMDDEAPEPAMLREARIKGRQEQRQRTHDYLVEDGLPTQADDDAPDIGSGNITLDRTNLLRLVDIIEKGGPTVADMVEMGMRKPYAEAIQAGYETAVESFREAAVISPHLYGDKGYPAMRSGGVEAACKLLHDTFEREWATEGRPLAPWDDVPEEQRAIVRRAVSVLLEALGMSPR